MEVPRQVLELTIKSLGQQPPTNPTLLMTRFADPMLVTVTDCTVLVVPTAWSGNVSSVGARAIAGPPTIPVPLKNTTCAAFVSLVTIRIWALRVPTVVGL